LTSSASRRPHATRSTLFPYTTLFRSHFYIGNEIDMTDALALRQKLNESFAEEGIKISVNDLVVKACAQALEKFPEVNDTDLDTRSEEHTSELQSPYDIVCRLLLEKKK